MIFIKEGLAPWPLTPILRMLLLTQWKLPTNNANHELTQWKLPTNNANCELTQWKLPTNNANHKFSGGLINASEQGVIHDGVLGQELGVSQNGLHQHALGMGVHIHWTVADVCVCVEREQGPPTNNMICTQNGA